MPDPALVAAYRKILRLSYGDAVGGDPSILGDIRTATEEQLDAFALKMANTLERSVFQSPVIRVRIQNAIDDWLATPGDVTLSDLALDLEPFLGATRALLIARTETGMGWNAAAAYSYQALGYKRVRWIASPFACDKCTDLDGEEFDIDEYVNEAIAHPNCSCGAEPVEEEEQPAAEGGEEEDPGYAEAA